MGGKKPLRRPLWPPTRATASNYYPLGLDGAGGAAKPLLRAPKKPAPLHGRLPAFSGAVDAFERARKCFLEWRYFFSIILSEFLKNRVALQPPPRPRPPAWPEDCGASSAAARCRRGISRSPARPTPAAARRTPASAEKIPRVPVKIPCRSWLTPDPAPPCGRGRRSPPPQRP